MRKFHLLVTLLLPLLVMASGEGEIGEKVKLQNMNVVKAAAEELSKDLPKSVDPFTRLVSITAEGESLVYTFEIDAGGKSDEDVVKEGRERMKKNVTAGICRSSGRFLQSGILISYRYISAATKRPLFRFDVDEKECMNLR